MLATVPSGVRLVKMATQDFFFSLKELILKQCGTAAVDAKVELLRIHLPGDVAYTGRTFYVYVRKWINETSAKSSDIPSSLFALPLKY